MSLNSNYNSPATTFTADFSPAFYVPDTTRVVIYHIIIVICLYRHWCTVV